MSSPGADTIRVTGCRPLSGRLRTPGDKSISHRALIIGALAPGTTTVRGLSDGDDVARTAAAVEALGATVTRGPGTTTVVGGRDGLRGGAEIDCGNSGTSLRLLAGVCATLDGATTLFGDRSLSSRPMDRIAEPLGAMGAAVSGRGPKRLPPLVVAGGRLHGIEWTPPMASAQVKSCILFAGLDADGETVVTEPVPTRAHTEEMLAAAGADISVEAAATGRRVRIRRSTLRSHAIDVPGDPSQAAFWLVGACVVPDSAVRVERVYAGADRLGFVRVLERMGADIGIEGSGDHATLRAASGPLRATEVEAAEIPSLDEVPVLAVAAAAAAGTTTFRDVAELTVKESDRLSGTVALVEALGARAHAAGDTLVVEGSGRIGPGAVRFHSRGDHRLAMAAVIGALACPAGGVVAGLGAVDTSYRGFLADLDVLAGDGAWAPVRDPGPR